MVIYILSPQVVNGWYYLLGEDVGRRKHMEVQGEPRQPLATKNENRGTNDFQQYCIDYIENGKSMEKCLIV